MGLEGNIYQEIPTNETGILQTILGWEEEWELDFSDFEIDLVSALVDTDDEFRVDLGYSQNDRKAIWTGAAEKYIGQLNQAEFLLYSLRGRSEPEFNAGGFVFSIVYALQYLFFDQRGKLPHIRKYCDEDLVIKLETEMTYLDKELDYFTALLNHSNFN